MKYLSIGLLMLFVFVSGCKKGDDNTNTSPGGTPLPAAGFKINNMLDANHVKEGQNLKFENTSVNAVSYSWDFGNGYHYEGKTPIGIYYIPCGGSYTITLSTKNSVGEISKYSQSFEVLCSGKNSHGLHLAD